MQRTYMFPQLGFSIVGGPAWGNALDRDVINYQGPSVLVGGSLGTGSWDYFESVNPNTGIPNGDIKGIAGGGGLSVLPLEVHAIYVQANHLGSFSYP